MHGLRKILTRCSHSEQSMGEVSDEALNIASKLGIDGESVTVASLTALSRAMGDDANLKKKVLHYLQHNPSTVCMIV